MTTIQFTECKQCGATYYTSETQTVLKPLDDVEIILKRIVKCSACQKLDPRQFRTKKRFPTT